MSLPSLFGHNRDLPRMRRSPILLASGVLLVAVGALTSAGIYTSLSKSQSVIVVVAAVERGQQITRADLTTAQMWIDPMLKPIPASEMAAVVGQYATVDLNPGNFLTPQAVGARISPAVGEAEVGLVLGVGEFPNTGLRSGDKVLLVVIPDLGNPDSEIGAVSATIEHATSNGTTLTASVMVRESEAGHVAALSAMKKLAMVLESRGG